MGGLMGYRYMWGDKWDVGICGGINRLWGDK